MAGGAHDGQRWAENKGLQRESEAKKGEGQQTHQVRGTIAEMMSGPAHAQRGASGL